MSLAFRLSAALGLAVLGASPCLAMSENTMPVSSGPAARVADPDAALGGLFKHFADPSDMPMSPRAQEHGPVTTYHITTAKGPRRDDGYDMIRDHPSDPSFNPFMSDSADEPQKDAAAR